VKSYLKGKRNHRPWDIATPDYSNMVELSEPIEPYKHVQFHLDDLNLDNYNNCVDEEFFNFTFQKASRYAYNLNLSLIHWIKIVKKSSNLSNVDIDKLFTIVLFHPNFELDDVSLKFTYNVDKFERSFIVRMIDGRKKTLVNLF